MATNNDSPHQKHIAPIPPPLRTKRIAHERDFVPADAPAVVIEEERRPPIPPLVAQWLYFQNGVWVITGAQKPAIRHKPVPPPLPRKFVPTVRVDAKMLERETNMVLVEAEIIHKQRSGQANVGYSDLKKSFRR